MRLVKPLVSEKFALFAFFSFALFIDQISKYLIRHNGGFYICNKDVAFGIKLDGIFFWFFWTIAFSLLIYLLKNVNCELQRLRQSDQNFKILNFRFLHLFRISSFGFRIFGILLIISGALSNIIDRAYFGCVIDFIDLKIWPIFNLADVFITVGAIIIIFKSLKSKV